jgi:hypothetical protein
MWTVMTEALELLTAAAAAITPDQRDAPTPCSEWTVTQVLQHAAGDQLAWAAAVGTGTGPDDNPFEPSGSFDGGLDQLVAPAVAVAEAAWATVADGGAPAAARAIVEPLRQYGAYAAALAPQPDDDATAELLRYLGRDPSWSTRA